MRCQSRRFTPPILSCAHRGWTYNSNSFTPCPAGATTRDDLPNQFAGITFFDGKPEEKASLAPDSESKRAGRIFSTWTFVPGRPIFVACHYALTTVMLMRPLPKEVHACTVVYNSRPIHRGATRHRKDRM